MPNPIISSTSPKECSPSRLFYFDLLRAFACLSVVMIHVSMSFAVKEVGSTSFWVGNFFDSFSRAGVPLFVMISGALMLDENYVFTKEKWGKHIIRMLSFFAFWSIAYCVVFQVIRCFIKHEEIKLFSIAWSILRGHFHLWFIPMIIGLYLLIPLLRLWIKSINRRYVEYFLILSVLFAFIIPQSIQLLVCVNPTFEYLYTLTDNINMKYTLGYTSYFVLGWYLHNYELPRKSLVYTLGIIGVCITIGGTYGIFAFTKSDEFVFYSNFSVNVLLFSIAIFVLSKSLFSNVKYGHSIFHKTVGLIGKYSLGVYAVHVAVITIVSRLFTQAHAIIAIPSIFFVCVIVSILSSYVISKIPFIQKFI